MLVRSGDRLSPRSVTLLSVVAVLLLIKGSGAVPNLLGLAPQDEKYYQSAIIKCRDGSKSFPQERLNDDFCDCVDGTDEPGTNACPESKFYCRNVGHRPSVLFSSRVNDGICDCCDGSDEYDGKVTCRNTCWEAGEKSREKLRKKLGVFKEGSSIRKQDLENSKKVRRQHEESLVPLKREEKQLKSMVDKLRADKEAVEKEEKRAREEQERIEKEERERREIESTAAKEESQQAEVGPDHVEEHAEDPEISGTTEEERVDSAPDPNTDADDLAHLTEEERGRVIASRWTGEDVSDIKVKGEAESKGHPDSGDEDEDDAADESDDHHDDDHESDDHLEDEDYGRASFSDSSTLIGSQSLGGDDSWWSKLMNGPSAILKMFGFSGRQHVDISEAERIRKEFREASDKLHGVQSKISDLENRLKEDYGKDSEFYSFYDKCFELKDKKYTYKICPYKDATQQEGHVTTRLGRWQGFKDDYTSMVFEQGDRCWNGPERSMRVKMRCGTKLELRTVNEPSRCEYAAEFSTPALCLESRVQELEQQLVVQDIPRDETHDEL